MIKALTLALLIGLMGAAASAQTTDYKYKPKTNAYGLAMCV